MSLRITLPEDSQPCSRLEDPKRHLLVVIQTSGTLPCP